MDRRVARATLLGTGTSTGVPVIGCTCRVCTSSDPRDNRLRCSCYVEVNGIGLLIDAGPDFRYQALRHPIEQIDAVLITHHHFDHVVGLDDLRPYLFENRTAIPCYTADETADVLERMFAYIFKHRDYPGTANLELKRVSVPFLVSDRTDGSRITRVTPVPVLHGEMEIFGYRIGGFAYLTDTSHIPETSLGLLSDLDVLVLDGLRHEPHTKHMTLSDAVRTAQGIGARQTYFIHMAHSLKHAEEDAALPDGMNLGYDGLTMEFAAD